MRRVDMQLGIAPRSRRSPNSAGCEPLHESRRCNLQFIKRRAYNLRCVIADGPRSSTRRRVHSLPPLRERRKHEARRFR
jgi:hypothetical protein